MLRVWTQCDSTGHKILSSLTLRPAAAAAMLNNLAVSAGGLNLGGEMGHKKEGGGGGGSLGIKFANSH